MPKSGSGDGAARARGAAKAASPLIAAGVLVGCSGGGNHTSPTLAITHASVAGDRAVLDLRISNESGDELTLSGIDYTLVYGPSPVADGSWIGTRILRRGGTAVLTLLIPFDGPPLDGSVNELGFAGQMLFENGSASGNLQMRSAAFDETSTLGD